MLYVQVYNVVIIIKFDDVYMEKVFLLISLTSRV